MASGCLHSPLVQQVFNSLAAILIKSHRRGNILCLLCKDPHSKHLRSLPKSRKPTCKRKIRSHSWLCLLNLKALWPNNSNSNKIHHQELSVEVHYSNSWIPQPQINKHRSQLMKIKILMTFRCHPFITWASIVLKRLIRMIIWARLVATPQAFLASFSLLQQMALRSIRLHIPNP